MGIGRAVPPDIMLKKPNRKKEKAARDRAIKKRRDDCRAEVFRLDHNHCRYPGCKSTAVTWAHLIGREANNPDLDTPENTISLCLEHHTWADQGHTFVTGDRRDRIETRMSGIGIKIFILGKYLFSPEWRWQWAWDELHRRKKEGQGLPVR